MVGGILQTARPRRRGPRGKLTDGQIASIVKAYQAGHKTVQEIADSFDVSRQYIYRRLAQEGIDRAAVVRRVPAVTDTPAVKNPPDATKSEPLVNSTTSGSAKPGVSAREEV